MALINCPECEKKVSDSAASCPYCGYKISVGSLSSNNQYNVTKAQLVHSENHTNHVLHLLLSVFSAGLWVVPWIFISISNSRKRDEALKVIENEGKTKINRVQSFQMTDNDVGNKVMLSIIGAAVLVTALIYIYAYIINWFN